VSVSQQYSNGSVGCLKRPSLPLPGLFRGEGERKRHWSFLHASLSTAALSHSLRIQDWSTEVSAGWPDHCHLTEESEWGIVKIRHSGEDVVWCGVVVWWCGGSVDR
jgi:hypothetical protein